MGSPPPAGSKKEVLILRSVKSMVIAPASTGKESSNKIAVIKTDHTKRGIRSNEIPLDRILMIVVIKFTAPRIEEIPAKCKEKIAKSTEAPACETLAERGG